MFARVISLFMFAAPLASALQLNALQNVNNGETVTITWTVASTDVPFTLELFNTLFNNEYAIANNVDPAGLSYNWTVPTVPIANDYVILAVNIGNISDVYSMTPVFAIGPIGSSTTTGSGSTSTLTATGTSTNSGSATANSRPVTTSTTTGTGTSSSTGTDTATSSGTAASTTPSSAAVSSHVALTNACGYAVLLLSVVGGAVAVAL